MIEAYWETLISPLQGLSIFFVCSTQGVALGYDIAPFQGFLP